MFSLRLFFDWSCGQLEWVEEEMLLALSRRTFLHLYKMSRYKLNLWGANNGHDEKWFVVRRGKCTCPAVRRACLIEYTFGAKLAL